MNPRDYQKLAENFINNSKPSHLYLICSICNNPNISIEFVKNNLNKPLNWTNLSSNTSISLKDIYDNIDLPWNFPAVFRRNDFTRKFFLLFKEKAKFTGKYSYYHLSFLFSRFATIEELEKTDVSSWNMIELSHNTNVNTDFVKKYIYLHWNWSVLLFRDSYYLSAITINYKDLLIYNGNFFNFLDILLQNISWAPFHIIKEYIHHFLDNSVFWTNISRNTSISTKFIEEYIDKPWFYPQLSCNICLTPAFIKKYIDKPWAFDNLSSNPKINIKLIKETLHKPWNWISLSRNDNITFKDIYENLNLPWNFTYVMYNRNIKFRHLGLLPIPNDNYCNFISNSNLSLDNLIAIQKENIPILNHPLFLNYYNYDKKLQIIAKNTIVKYYRRYKLNYKLKHIAKQSLVLDELKYKPNLGVEFFKTMKDIDEIFLNFQ